MRLGGYFDRDVEVTLREVEIDDSDVGITIRFFKPLEVGDEGFTGSPIVNGVKLFPEYDSARYKLVATSVEEVNEGTKRVLVNTGNYETIYVTRNGDWSYHKAPGYHEYKKKITEWRDRTTLVEYTTFTVYVKTATGWQLLTTVKAKTQTRYVDDYTPAQKKAQEKWDLSGLKDTPQEKQMMDNFLDQIRDYVNSKYTPDTATDNGQLSRKQQGNKDAQRIESYDVRLYAADIVPDDDALMYYLIPNTKVGTGFFTEISQELTIGGEYSYSQLKASALGSSLYDPDKGKLPTNSTFKVISIEPTGQPRRYKRGLKDWTVILPHSTAKVKVVVSSSNN